MKCLLISLILILTSCSFNKNSSYWNKDSFKKSVENIKPSKISVNKNNFNIMTFEEFDLYLKDYSKKTDYPDINN